MANSDTNTYGLLGRGISYSLSPSMHNAAFKYYAIPAIYEIFDKQHDELDAFFREYVISGKVKGFNVTVPYKIKVKEFVEGMSGELHEWVKITGALNTVKMEDGIPCGFNTDVYGFFSSLQDEFNIKIGHGPKYNIFVAGSGGAGRAIALFLGHMPTGNIKVFDIDAGALRSLEKAFALCESGIREKFCAISCPDAAVRACAAADIVINATPLGTQEGDPLPVSEEALRPGQMVYDLVYARETELVSLASRVGARTANGLGMLVNQAAMAFEKWTGKPFEEVKDVMREAALSEMKRR